jgi:hypothetical protein
VLLGGAHETRRQGRLAQTKLGPTLGCRKVSAFVSSSRSCELSFARFSGSDLDAKRNLSGDSIRYMQRTGTLDLTCVAKLAHGGGFRARAFGNLHPRRATVSQSPRRRVLPCLQAIDEDIRQKILSTPPSPPRQAASNPQPRPAQVGTQRAPVRRAPPPTELHLRQLTSTSACLQSAARSPRKVQTRASASSLARRSSIAGFATGPTPGVAITLSHI